MDTDYKEVSVEETLLWFVCWREEPAVEIGNEKGHSVPFPGWCIDSEDLPEFTQVNMAQ